MPVFHRIRVHVNRFCQFTYIGCHPGPNSRRERSRQRDFLIWDVKFSGRPHDATITFPNGTPLNTNVVHVPPGGASAPELIVTNNWGIYKYSVQVGTCFDDPDIEVEPPISFFDLNDNFIAASEAGELSVRRPYTVKAGDFVRWISQGPPDMLDFTIQFDEDGPSPFVSGEYSIVSVPDVGATVPRQTLNAPGDYAYTATLVATQSQDSAVMKIFQPPAQAKKTATKKKTKK
jgi:hypothetical protein